MHESCIRVEVSILTCLPYLRESCWNFSWGPKLSHFFHIFTHEYVTLHLWVCTFSLAGMSPFTRGYATFHSRVCHRSLAGMPLFTRGYVTLHSLVDHVSLASMSPFTRGYATFHWRVCHLSFAGMPLFTRRCVPFYSWVCHFSLLSLSPFTRGFVTFHSRVLYLPLAAMSPFARGFATTHLWACHLSTVQPRICPNIPVISSFAIKHSFLCLVVYCFHLLMSVMFFFSHASLTNVTKKWSASNCDLKTPSRAARIWNPKFECNEAWNPSNGKSLRSWPQPWENSPARWVHQKVVAWWITRRVSFFNFSVLLECKTNLIIWSDRDSLG